MNHSSYSIPFHAIDKLASCGALFTWGDKGSKNPNRKKWNRLHNLVDGETAKQMAKAGLNVSAALGVNGVYCFDVDRDADRLHKHPQLAGTFYTYRPNAPHKAKFFFTCDQVIHTRNRKKYGFDLLGLAKTGNASHGVIYGIHASGAAIQFGGDHLAHLTIDDVEAIYADLTDTSCVSTGGGDRKSEFYYNSDSFGVDLTAIDADGLLQEAIAKSGNGRNNTGFLLACRLREQGVSLADALAVLHRYQQAVTRPNDLYTVQEAEASVRSAYSRSESDTPTPDLSARLTRYHAWLASSAALAELKAAGFRNPERARKLLDAILELCQRRQRLRITPGYGTLSQMTGIAQGGIGAYLARLFDKGYIELYAGNDGEATAIELVVGDRSGSMESSFSQPERSPKTDTVQVVKNWNLYRQYRSDDLFLNNHYAYNVTRPNAELLPLGDNGLTVLMALLDADGDTEAVAAATGLSYQAAARTLRRFVQHGVVDVSRGRYNRKTYRLKASWQGIFERTRPKTTTFAVQLFRREKLLLGRSKKLYAQKQYIKAWKMQEEYEKVHRQAVIVRKGAGIVPYVAPSKAFAEGRKRHQRQRKAAGPTMEQWAAWQYGSGWQRHVSEPEISEQYHLWQQTRPSPQGGYNDRRQTG